MSQQDKRFIYFIIIYVHHISTPDIIMGFIIIKTRVRGLNAFRASALQVSHCAYDAFKTFSQIDILYQTVQAHVMINQYAVIS